MALTLASCNVLQRASHLCKRGGMCSVAALASSRKRQRQHRPAKDQLTVTEHPLTYPYLKSMSLRQSPEQLELWQVVQKHRNAVASSPPEQAQFLAWLIRTLQAKKVVEIGVFLGYSTLSMAQALPNEGKLWALDISEESVDIARHHLHQAGMMDKVSFEVGPALDSLRRLVDAQEGCMDLCFIDADKGGYDDYYELSLRLLRPGGIVAVDNVLWHGKVLDEARNDRSTCAIRAINEKIKVDSRVDITMLPHGDGLTLCTKL